MRRVPAIVWILAPLAVGLLYAAGHALLTPAPTLLDLPPEDAILVHRVRGLDLLDLTSPGARGTQVRPARESLGRERNNPGLVGVDPDGWVHLVLMPRALGIDSTMAVFALRDADAFEREFMRTDFLERGLVRHAQHLRIQGPWAAVGPDRDATRRLGTGGITCADLGEDWSMAARVPALIDHALGMARQYPWAGLLAAVGVDTKAARLREDPATGVIQAYVPGDRRIERIRSAWRTARLWAWHDDGRLRIELEPAAGSEVARRLADLAPTAALEHEVAWPDAKLRPPPAPPSALAWLRMPHARQRAALAHVLLACGVRFRDGAARDPLGGWGEASDEAPAGLLLWGEPGRGTGFALTVGLAGPPGAALDVRPFLPQADPEAASVPLEAGAAPLTIGDTQTPRVAPAGTIERRTLPQGEVLALGASARSAAEGMAAFLGTRQTLPPLGAGLEAGWTPIARFFLRRDRAAMVLGEALEPGGLLAMLAGGDVHGTLSTDGRVLRLQVRRAR